MRVKNIPLDKMLVPRSTSFEDPVAGCDGTCYPGKCPCWGYSISITGLDYGFYKTEAECRKAIAEKIQAFREAVLREAGIDVPK
jgi:hypothetical protein